MPEGEVVITVTRVAPLVGKLHGATLKINDREYLAIFFSLAMAAPDDEGGPALYHMVQEIREDYGGYLDAIDEHDRNAEQQLAEWVFEGSDIGAQSDTLYQLVAVAIHEYYRHAKSCGATVHRVGVKLPQPGSKPVSIETSE